MDPAELTAVFEGPLADALAVASESKVDDPIDFLGKYLLSWANARDDLDRRVLDLLVLVLVLLALRRQQGRGERRKQQGAGKSGSSVHGGLRLPEGRGGEGCRAFGVAG